MSFKKNIGDQTSLTTILVFDKSTEFLINFSFCNIIMGTFNICHSVLSKLRYSYRQNGTWIVRRTKCLSSEPATNQMIGIYTII